MRAREVADGELSTVSVFERGWCVVLFALWGADRGSHPPRRADCRTGPGDGGVLVGRATRAVPARERVVVDGNGG